MEKIEALAQFDNSVAKAAAEIGCTPSAIRLWPDQLPPRIRDRVQAALWRRQAGRSVAMPAPALADAHPATEEARDAA